MQTNLKELSLSDLHALKSRLSVSNADIKLKVNAISKVDREIEYRTKQNKALAENGELKPSEL